MLSVRANIAALVIASAASLAGCGEDPSSAAAPEEGRRTSMAGRAMDRAEDLKKEVDNYNRAIEDTIAQGTGDAPPSAGKPPASGTKPPTRKSKPAPAPTGTP